jgi:choline-glycine betaine transporter
MKTIPNNQFQIPNKFQDPNSNVENKGNASLSFPGFGHWVIGTWCLFGIWCLKLGILISYRKPYTVNRTPSSFFTMG